MFAVVSVIHSHEVITAHIHRKRCHRCAFSNWQVIAAVAMVWLVKANSSSAMMNFW